MSAQNATGHRLQRVITVARLFWSLGPGNKASLRLAPEDVAQWVSLEKKKFKNLA